MSSACASMALRERERADDGRVQCNASIACSRVHAAIPAIGVNCVLIMIHDYGSSTCVYVGPA